MPIFPASKVFLIKAVCGIVFWIRHSIQCQIHFTRVTARNRNSRFPHFFLTFVMNLPVYHNVVWSSAFLRELILHSVNSVPPGAESVAWQGAQMKLQVQTVLVLDPTKRRQVTFYTSWLYLKIFLTNFHKVCILICNDNL